MMERRIQERHDSDGSEIGQDNKQGSMEEYHHQLYRGPQMTGKAREEEEKKCGQHTHVAMYGRALHYNNVLCMPR